MPGAASLAGPLAAKPSKVQRVALGAFGPACPYPCRAGGREQAFWSRCFPAHLPDPPQSVLEVNPAGAGQGNLGCKPEQQHSHTATNTRALARAARSRSLCNLCIRHPPGRVETPFHPQFPERRWEGGHPPAWKRRGLREAFPSEHLWSTKQPCRALWVCSPASQELGWSQEQRASPPQGCSRWVAASPAARRASALHRFCRKAEVFLALP